MMKHVGLDTIYKQIERIKPKKIALISQTIDRRIEYGDHKEDFTHQLRNREDAFVLELTKMGIQYESFSNPVQPDDRRWGMVDMSVLAGELSYQSITSAARLRRNGVKGPFFIEITEDEANNQSKLDMLVANAKRYDALDLLDNLVYLTKTRRDPKFIEFKGIISKDGEPSTDRHQNFTQPQTALTQVASDVEEPPVDRISTTVYRQLRDTELARKVKRLHEYKCQICGHVIILPDETRYAEAHHIKPLGLSHGGPDVIENILCLCPNHHAELDYGVSVISLELLHIHSAHPINQAFIDYHNRVICAGAAPDKFNAH